MNCAITLAAAIVGTTWLVGCGELDDELSDTVEVTSAFTFDECKGKIRDKYAAPGVAARVGTQLGDFESLGGGSARAHYSISASIYCNGTTGVTKIVQGLIRAKYLALVTPSIVGYPTTDELTTLFGGGRYNFFEHGSIIWKSGTNEAFEVHGQIRGHFQALSNEWGRMGFPTSDEVPVGTRRRNSFDFGNIYWTSSAGAWAVMTSTGTGQNQLATMNKPYIISASMRASTDGGCLSATGAGFTPGKTVQLAINNPDRIAEYAGSAVVAANGTFSFTDSGQCTPGSNIKKVNGVATVQAFEQTTGRTAVSGFFTSAGNPYVGNL